MATVITAEGVGIEFYHIAPPKDAGPRPALPPQRGEPRATPSGH